MPTPHPTVRESLITGLFPSAADFLHNLSTSTFTVPVLDLDLDEAARRLGVTSIKLAASVDETGQRITAGQVSLEVVF